VFSVRLNIARMDKETIVNRITEWRIISVRRIGRPTLRGEDDVREDVGRMRTENWSKLAWEKHGRELLNRPKLIRSCSAKRRISLRPQDRQL
jgi:hypothetical protein